MFGLFISLVVPVRRKHRDVPLRFFASKNFGHKLSRNRAEAQPHHPVPRSRRKIRKLRGPSDIRQSIRRTWPQPAPRLDALEIRRTKLRKIATKRVYNTAHPVRVYVV